MTDGARFASGFRVRQQRGQSTAEFVVLALALVPMILIVPLVGKQMDIAQTSAVASRYVGFEAPRRHGSSAAGGTSDTDLGIEARRRFFSNSDAPIKTDDVVSNFDASCNALWLDHRGNALSSSFETDVWVRTTRESLSQPFGAAFAGAFDWPRDNLYTAEVTFNVAKVVGVAPFDALGLSIRRATTGLVDPWSASKPSQVKSRGRNGNADFPCRRLELAALPADPDRAPADRLGPH